MDHPVKSRLLEEEVGLFIIAQPFYFMLLFNIGWTRSVESNTVDPLLDSIILLSQISNPSTL